MSLTRCLIKKNAQQSPVALSSALTGDSERYFFINEGTCTKFENRKVQA